MKLNIEPSDLTNIPGAREVMVAKIIQKTDFDESEISRPIIQAMLTNNIEIEGIRLLSPVVQQTTLNANVPTNWPDRTVTDEEGNVTVLKIGEYLRWFPVTGGFCLQYAGGPKGINNDIILPNNAQLRAQVTLAGGFTTWEEFMAIRINEEVPA